MSGPRITGHVRYWTCVAVLLLAPGAGAAASSSAPPALELLKASTQATADRPPPSRPCAGDCVVPSKYRTYEGFLRWAGDDARRFWSSAFSAAQKSFRPARQLIVAEGGSARTTCAVRPAVVRANAAIGPFYCARDEAVFLPALTTLYVAFAFAGDYRARDFRERDFALSFIVAHEWAHHVQAQLGIRRQSLRQELQADCLAGVWAYSAWARALLEPGDVAEAVALASRIGDQPGTPPGDATAHGTGAQRKTWFMRGYDGGRSSRCDTSAVPIR